MNWLIRLYPARWRQRYGDELQHLVRDLRPSTSRTAIAVDLAKGAIGAHLQQLAHRPRVDRAAVKRGGLIAGIVWLGLSAEIVLTNVVFTSTDDNSFAILSSYLCVFGALCGIGVVAARAGATRKVQAVASAGAGAVIGALTVVTFAVVDNVWLGIVSRQPQKIAGFAHSGAPSMRAYINHGLIGFAIFSIVAFGVIGAIMSVAGGGMVGRQVPTVPRPVDARRPNS